MSDENKKIEEKKYPKVVSGVYIFNAKGEVFLVRAPHWQNKLTIPGGHVEYRELAQDAAIREIKEETGLDIKDLELLGVDELTHPLEYGKNQNHIVSFEYKAYLVDENQEVILDEREGTEYVWIKPEDALKREDISSTIIKFLKLLSTPEKKKNFFGKSENQKCEELKKEIDDYKIGWQRALADYKNLQAETVKRRSEWAQMSEVQILEEFIPVYDHLKMSLAHCHSREGGNPDAWVDGVKHVLRQFSEILKNHGVEEIKTVGEKFDPKFHEAVGEETPSSDGASATPRETGDIVREIAGGYKVGDKIIRAARVIVSK